MEELKIDGITLPQFRNDDYIQYETDFLSIVLANDPVLLNVKTYYDACVAKMAEIDKLYSVSRNSLITDDIVAMDGRRDKAITGISLTVNASSFHYDPLFVAAAKILQNDIDKYGSGIARIPLAAETAVLTNICADWKNIPVLKDAVGQLNLAAWVNELDTANKAFNTLYLSRTLEQAALPDDKLLDKRNELNQLYYTLCKKLVANASVNEFIDPWSKTIKELNKLIEQYNQLLATREAHNKKKKDPPAA